MAKHKKNVTHPYLCFVAGKSGGHILPCITLAQQSIAQHPNYKILFFSTDDKLDSRLLSIHPLIQKHIALKLGNIPYGRIIKFIPFLFNLGCSFFKSLYHLYKYKPESVITTGGYIALPVCMAAWLLRIPIELYELNVIPGKAIKFLVPLASKVWICFQESLTYFPASKCSLANYPIKFSDKDKINSQYDALDSLQFSQDKRTILILGGSQGSLFINNLICTFIEQHPYINSSIQIIHQTGDMNTIDWQNFYQQKNIPAIVFSYNDTIEKYYAAADLIICRSGAGTLAEIIFFNKKCITIPLETKTTDHQLNNAYATALKNPENICVLKQQEVELNFKAFETATLQKLNITN